MWLCYAETLDALLHLDGRVTANHNKVVLSDLYPSMKYFYPDYSGLLLDVSHSIWLNEHMLKIPLHHHHQNTIDGIFLYVSL